MLLKKAGRNNDVLKFEENYEKWAFHKCLILKSPDGY